MDFSREPWRRIYVTESADFKALPLLCRALAAYLVKVARQQSGILVKNAATKDKGIDILLRACGAHGDELEMAKEYVHSLLEDGYLRERTLRGKYQLSIHEFVEAQTARSNSALRQQRYRDKKYAKEAEQQGLPLHNVSATRNVTRGVTSDVTRASQRKKDHKDQKEKKETKKHEVCERAVLFVSDPVRAGLEYGQPHDWSEVQDVLAHCGDVWEVNTHARTSGDSRVKTIVERLADGYTPTELKQAIDGSTKSDFIAQKRELQNVRTILKDGSAVDKYRDMRKEGPRGTQPPPRVQPPADSGYYDGDMGYGDAIRRGPIDYTPPDDPFTEENIAKAEARAAAASAKDGS